MTSKEKLKKMYDYIMIDNEHGLMDQEEVEAVTEDYNCVLNDLNKLEQMEKIKILENETKNLKEQNKILACNSRSIAMNDIKIMKRDLELQEENQELKNTNTRYVKVIDDFQSKNMRLEKAIDILKGRFEFKFSDDIKIIYLFVKGIPLHIYSWVFKSQQEYELAKEVFGESEWKMY